MIKKSEMQELLKSLDYSGEGQGHANTLCAKAAIALRQLLDGEAAWLIEAPGQQYLAVRRLGGIGGRYDFVWSADHNKALKFCSQEQADALMMAVREMDRDLDSLQNHGKLSWGKLFAFETTLGNARPVEHAWMRAA